MTSENNLMRAIKLNQSTSTKEAKKWISQSKWIILMILVFG